MFKNKKIVAMVLCALMLFVPVAAMAAPLVDLLDKFSSAATVDTTTLSTEQEDYRTAVDNAIADPSETNKGNIKTAVDDYAEALKDAKKEYAAAEKLMKQIEGMKLDGKKGYEIFTQDTDKSFAAADKDAAKEAWDKAVQDLKVSKKAIADIEAKYKAYADFYKAAMDSIEKAAKAVEDAQNLEQAETALDNVVALYENAEYPDMIAPLLKKAWDKYASFANELEEASKLSELETSHEKAYKALGNVNMKRSMTAEGWTVFTKNDKDVFANVAEMKVTKEGKQTIIKLYDAAGKEVKLNETLYIWMPIKKGTNVKNVKVDGDTVTFKTLKEGTIVEFSAEF